MTAVLINPAGTVSGDVDATGCNIISNDISGAGYAVVNTSTMYAIPIDASTTFTNRPKVHANK